MEFSDVESNNSFLSMKVRIETLAALLYIAGYDAGKAISYND